MTVANETHTTKTRERRFSKVFLAEDKSEVDGADIGQVENLGIRVDGQLISFDLTQLPGETLTRLAFDAIYDKLTRSVHAAKPTASDTESAIKVIEETFAIIKSGKLSKSRGGGGRGRAFDTEAFKVRFRNALKAGAKAMKVNLSEAKVENYVNAMLTKSGKERQDLLTKKYFKDPYFKAEWDKPVLEKKKAAIKSGEVESPYADLM